jgi:hypothetical protein
MDAAVKKKIHALFELRQKPAAKKAAKPER